MRLSVFPFAAAPPGPVTRRRASSRLRLALVLLLLALLPLVGHAAVKKTLLFESTIYPWKIHFVRDTRLWVGTQRYYAVSYNGQPLVLPKELFGGSRDIERFLAAAGFDSGETHSDSVLLVFENFKRQADEYEEREFVTVQARSLGAHTNRVALYTLEGVLLAEIELDGTL